MSLFIFGSYHLYQAQSPFIFPSSRTILTFPIREQTGIIGVGQLINKVGDPYFDAMDEEMALAFSIYCGVCIIHSVVYQKLQEAHIRNALANELVMYHMQVRY